MNPGIVFPLIVLVAIVFVLVPVLATAVSHFRGPWRLRCPEDGGDAQVRFDVLDAARAELGGHRVPAVVRCSSWPERRGCAQRCLASPSSTWRRPDPGERLPRRSDDGCPTILVALDGTAAGERALEVASGLAQVSRARLQLVQVAPVIPRNLGVASVAQLADREIVQAQARALAYLRGVSARLAGLAVDHVVRCGEPASQIVRAADDAHADLIVMADARGWLARRLGRSVSRRVWLRADVPVLLVPAAGAA